MGCCQSTTAVTSNERSFLPASLRGPNRGVRTDRVEWQADSPITETEWNALKEAFWHTAPAYEGRLEIWQSLRAACDALTTDQGLAQTIIQSAEIHVPTGRLTDGCYDALGNRYVIPPYCIFPPSNLISLPQSLPSPTSAPAVLVTEPAKVKSSLMYNVRIRLTTGKDLEVNVDVLNETVEDLMTKVAMELSSSKGVRLFRLGKELAKKAPLKDILTSPQEASVVILAMLSS